MDDRLGALWAGNIAAARKAAGLTQKKAAELCGVDQTTFSRWERGKLVPSEDNKRVIARQFGLESRDMFTLELPDETLVATP